MNHALYTGLDEANQAFIEQLAQAKQLSVSKAIAFCVTLMRKSLQGNALTHYSYSNQNTYQKGAYTALNEQNIRYIRELSEQKNVSKRHAVILCVAYIREHYSIEELKELEIIAW